MEDEVLRLGGNIELTGFSELDGGVMIVLKKIIGNYAKKMSERTADFERLHMTMKIVHAKEKSEKYEIHSKLIHGGSNILVGESVDRNLFVAVDDSLKKVVGSMSIEKPSWKDNVPKDE
jgi:hypothetical protein